LRKHSKNIENFFRKVFEKKNFGEFCWDRLFVVKLDVVVLSCCFLKGLVENSYCLTALKKFFDRQTLLKRVLKKFAFFFLLKHFLIFFSTTSGDKNHKNTVVLAVLQAFLLTAFLGMIAPNSVFLRGNFSQTKGTGVKVASICFFSFDGFFPRI